MSPSCRKVYDAIRDLTAQRGFSPTVREICKHTGFSSSSTVAQYISRLRTLGLVYSVSNSPRTLKVTEKIPDQEVA